MGDSLESVYIVAWNVHQFFRSPLHLFDANVFHPLHRALTFTDHRLLPSLVVSPVVWLTGNPVAAYNGSVALACLLAAFAARHLARLLGADEVGAWAAGALYAFHTYQINEAPRLNIVWHGFLPLALAALLGYLKTGERRRAWATALWMLLLGLSSNYHLLYGSLVLGLVVIAALVARPRMVASRLPALFAAAATAALLFAPIALPYLETSREHGYSRGLPEGIDLVHYFSTSPTNLLYGPIGADVRLQQKGPHFVGFAALALALVALGAWAGRRGPDEDEALVAARHWVPLAAALALLFVALSLGREMMAFGHDLGPGPYRLLYAFVPGFRLVRIPERLGLLAMLFVSLLVARGLTLIRGTRLRTVALFLAALIPAEHLSPLPLTTAVPVRDQVPLVYEWLAGQATGALAEVPIRGEGLVREETLDMYFSTAHWKPIIHGYTAFPPLLTRLLRRLAARFPSEVARQAFARVGVDTVVVHYGRPLGTDLFNQLNSRGPIDLEKFPALLRRADLNLYEKLGAAREAGWLRLDGEFGGPPARLFESSKDEVYRILPGPRMAAAAFPTGHRRRDVSWRYRAKVGDASLAGDDDLETSWTVGRALHGDEFLEVTFDRLIRVRGIVLPLNRDSVLPTMFRVAGRERDGHWRELARFDDAHALQLLDRLLADPRSAALGFDLGNDEWTGVSLLMEEGGTSFEGWTIPELEVWVP